MQWKLREIQTLCDGVQATGGQLAEFVESVEWVLQAEDELSHGRASLESLERERERDRQEMRALREQVNVDTFSRKIVCKRSNRESIDILAGGDAEPRAQTHFARARV